MHRNRRSKRTQAALRAVLFDSLESRTFLAATRIMPLGDSITEAQSGHASYRWSLYNQLTQAGYDVDFVGNRTGIGSGSPLYSNFDPDHQGTSGFRADQIQSNIVSWATQNPPDVVLLHIGANDISQGQSNSSTITEIGGIIDNLRSVVPDVKILLAQIIPGTTNASQYPLLNGMISTLAGQKNTVQSPVILVDQFTGFSTSADLYDGIHPDDSGERKIANKFMAALQTILPAPTPPAPVTYLSDLTPTSSSNGWGPIEKDMSNGETSAGDGRYIGLNGIGYLKGIGVHAASDIRYNLVGGNYSEFRADIGVDDEVGSSGLVQFQVYVDNTLRYTSPNMSGTSATISIPAVDVTGASTLRLVVTVGGNGNANDHADWANARLIALGTTPPATPSGFDAAVSGNQINLTWVDNASDETGYRVQRKIGVGGTWQQLGADLPANTQAFSDTTVSTGVTYYYRVLAIKGAATSGFSNEDNATISAAPGTIYLSDLTPTSSSNGWGPIERDRSNGETGATDGNVITLNGVTYSKGLGFHAYGEAIYTLNGQYTQFLSDIGIDDEAGNNGSVIFQVFLNGSTTPIYQSPLLTGASATVSLPAIDVTGVQTLKLVVTDGGNGNAYDHADWANARLVSGPVVPAPNAPTSLDAVVNGNQVNLTWADNATDETGYRVQRKIGAGGVWQQLGADLPANTQAFSDSTVSTGVVYYYRVLAFNGAVLSNFSNEDNVTIPTPPNGTTYLSDLVPTSSSNGWGPFENDRSNGETGATDGNVITLNGVTYAKGLGFHANGEVVYALNGLYTQFLADIGIDDEAGNNGSVIFQVFLDNSTTPIYQSPLMTGASQTISIPAIDVTGRQSLKLVVTDGGNGNNYDHADWANARLLNGAPVTPPATPSGLDAVVSGNQINLTWVDNATDETAYRVQRKTGVGGVWQQLGVDLAANAQAYSDTTASAGVEYYYRVLAVKGAVVSAFSNEDNATIPVTLPATPTGLDAVVSGNQINLTWVDNATDETGYRVQRKIDVGGVWQQIGADLSANTQAYSDTAVSPNVNYYYRVVAVKGAVVSAFSNEDNATIPVTLPATPTGLDAVVSGNQINLTWVDNATDETAYRVQRKTGVGGVWQQLGADLAANTQAYSDTTASAGVNYYYRVLAVKGAVVSGFSNEDNVTIPAPPTGTTYLSNLTPTSSSNGWGPFENDRSNGETGATDGNVITLNGTTYPKGLGFHANGQATYALNGLYTQFLSDIGIDDEVGNSGSVIFQVFLDNSPTPVYQSPVMTGSSQTISIPAIDVTGRQTLRLVVTDAGNGNASDHADWANARLLSPVGSTPWFGDIRDYRQAISINVGAFARTDQPLDTNINFTSILGALGGSGSLIENSIKVVEVSADGSTLINGAVPFQFDKASNFNAATNASGTLVILAQGNSAANATRYYQVYFDTVGSFSAPSFTALVTTTDNDSDQGQVAIKVENQTATYWLQKQNGGFSSIVDKSGNDWLGFNPTPGSQSGGEFRGTPNAVFPGGGFHAGFVIGSTQILNTGPLKTTVESTITVAKGTYKMRYEFYNNFVRATMVTAGGSYWFLYEGTPGGNIDANDTVVRSDGTVTSISTAWNDNDGLGTGTGEEWLYFRDSAADKYIYFVHNTADNLKDSYYRMDVNGSMTVFGFGRDNEASGDHSLMTAQNNSFTFGIANGGGDFNSASGTIKGQYKVLNGVLGAAQVNS